MEDKNIKEAGKVVLTDEELMEIVGGTGDQDGTRYSVAEFCRQFENIEELPNEVITLFHLENNSVDKKLINLISKNNEKREDKDCLL